MYLKQLHVTKVTVAPRNHVVRPNKYDEKNMPVPAAGRVALNKAIGNMTRTTIATPIHEIGRRKVYALTQKVAIASFMVVSSF